MINAYVTNIKDDPLSESSAHMVGELLVTGGACA
jgi:hypothetical protein